MNTEAIIEQIDAEISKLQQAKVLLTGATAISTKRSPGRPKATNATPKPVAARRVMSAEGKAKIAEAQRARWAKSKRRDKRAAKAAAAPVKAVKSTAPAKAVKSATPAKS